MEQGRLNKDYFDQDFVYSHNISESWEMTNFEFHDLFEIYYALTDNVSFFVNDKMYLLKKGDLIILNNMDVHKSILPHGTTSYERCVIEFGPRYIESFCTPITDLLECFLNRETGFTHLRCLTEEQSKTLFSLFEKIELNYYSNGYGKDVLVRTTFVELLILINLIYSPNIVVQSFAHGGSYDKIKPILKYINENLEKPLTIEHLAKTFFIGKYYICYLFKKTMGFTLNEYIISCRIRIARGLLKKNKMLVSQISEAVGFNNVTHFNRVFKKIIGLTPKQYTNKD